MITLDKQLTTKVNIVTSSSKTMEALKDLFDFFIKNEYQTLDTAKDTVEIYRSQGAIQILKDLKNLHEMVKDSKDRHYD